MPAAPDDTPVIQIHDLHWAGIGAKADSWPARMFGCPQSDRLRRFLSATAA